jgi:hypothetical protein
MEDRLVKQSFIHIMDAILCKSFWNLGYQITHGRMAEFVPTKYMMHDYKVFTHSSSPLEL